MLQKLNRAWDKWEKVLDAFSYAPLSSLVVWLYGGVWFALERGNIGFDGFLALVGVDLLFSNRRWANRNK